MGGSSLGGTGGGGAPGGSGSGGAGASAGGALGGGGTAALDGKGLYEANCRACHGDQGVGGPLAYEIVHPVRDYSTWVVRNGRAQTTFPQPMDKWDTTKLSDAQLMLIFDYLDEPPQPTTGKALYDDYCASCHGADAKGGPTMRPLTNEVGKVLTQARSGKNVGKFARRRDYMPAFPSSDLSDAELMLIRDYVDSL
jgi:mono/diheme cytochrome c family protein